MVIENRHAIHVLSGRRLLLDPIDLPQLVRVWTLKALCDALLRRIGLLHLAAMQDPSHRQATQYDTISVLQQPRNLGCAVTPTIRTRRDGTFLVDSDGAVLTEAKVRCKLPRGLLCR
jgi:hypothetical protein